MVTRPPKPITLDPEPRLAQNAIKQLERETRQLAQRALLVERCLIRGERVVITPEPPTKPLPIRATVPPSDAWPTLDEINARIARLAADAAAERARVDALKQG
jgi:hypothetical protein